MNVSRRSLSALLFFIVGAASSACGSSSRQFLAPDDGADSGNAGAGGQSGNMSDAGGRDASGGSSGAGGASGAAGAGGTSGSGGAGGAAGTGGTSGSGGAAGSAGASGTGGASGAGGSGTDGGSGTGGSGGGDTDASTPPCGAPGIACCANNACNAGASCGGGQCSCDANLTACGTACVDLTADGKNCGRCGHDCLGGECNLSTCQAVTIATNQAYANTLVTDGTYVYWIGGQNTHFVARRRVDMSDDVKTIAPSESSGYSLALSSTSLYWGASGHIRVCNAPDCSNGPQDFLSPVASQPWSRASCGDSMAFAASTQTIFFACPSDYNAKNGAIWSLPLTATTPAVFGPNPSNPGGLVSDGTSLYWLSSSTYTSDNQNPDGAMYRARISDGTITTLATGIQGDLGGMVAVGGNNLYYSGYDTIGAAYTLGVYRVSLPNGIGGAQAPLFFQGSVLGMVADDQYLYFSNATSSPGVVARCPHSSCAAPEVISSNNDAPYALAEDAVSIYWTTYGAAGAIRRLAK